MSTIYGIVVCFCTVQLFGRAIFVSGDACTTLTCSSRGYTYHECTVPHAATITTISVKTKYSSSPCVNGISFGSALERVWVNTGCRAQFNVCYKPGFIAEKQCSSWQYRRATCQTSLPNIDFGIMKDKHSSSDCIEGVSYGFSGNEIWVRNGCRATFKVYALSA